MRLLFYTLLMISPFALLMLYTNYRKQFWTEEAEGIITEEHRFYYYKGMNYQDLPTYRIYIQYTYQGKTYNTIKIVYCSIPVGTNVKLMLNPKNIYEFVLVLPDELQEEEEENRKEYHKRNFLILFFIYLFLFCATLMQNRHGLFL